MIPIRSEEDFARTREYAAKLEDVLLAMRRTHTPEQYEHFSKSFIKELSEAKHEVLLYLHKHPPSRRHWVRRRWPSRPETVTRFPSKAL